MERRGVAQHRLQHPGVGGHDEVPLGLDEGPLTVDSLVQQVLRQRLGARDGGVPTAYDDVPRLPEPGGVRGPHENPVGVAAVELGLDQRCDVHPVDRHLLDVAVDRHPLEPGAADHGILEVDVVEARPAEVDLLEAAVPQVGAQVVGHTCQPVTDRRRDARQIPPPGAARPDRESVLRQIYDLGMSRPASIPTSVRPIAHLSIVDRVTDELHRAILNGDIAPSSTVSIVDLCEQFAVSHIPVREALRRLESEGLISLRPGRSALVAALSIEDLSGTYRLRKLIEGDLAERTADQVSEETLADAGKALATLSTVEHEPASFAAELHAFYAALLTGVAGAADLRVLGTLWMASDRYLHLALRDPNDGHWADSMGITELMALLCSSPRLDGIVLRNAWLAHLDASEQTLLGALAGSSHA